MLLELIEQAEEDMQAGGSSIDAANGVDASSSSSDASSAGAAVATGSVVQQPVSKDEVEDDGLGPESLFEELRQLDPKAIKEDYFDGQWDIGGLESDLQVAKAKKSAEEVLAEEAPPSQPLPEAAAEGGSDNAVAQKMFAELQAIDSRVAEEDYHDTESGIWDVQGLEEDLSIAKQQAQPSAPAPEAAPTAPRETAAEPRALLKELQAIDSSVLEGDYHDADADVWDVEGLEDDLRVAKQRQEAAPRAEEKPPAADPRALLKELQAIDSSVLEGDYHDGDDVWDVEGLEDDLRVAKQRQEAAASTDAPSAPSAEKSPLAVDPRALLKELQHLDSSVAEADYYDADTDVWDIEGLEDDLRVAQEQQGSVAATVAPDAAPAARASDESKGAQMFAELQALDAGANRDDYFDPNIGTWDLAGLMDDIQLAQNKLAPAPPPPTAAGSSRGEELLAKLQKLDPAVEREDYYDAGSGAWDVEGLQDDLRLAERKASASPAKAAADDGDDPEALMRQLHALESGVQREDYFNAESGEWDLEGLQEDLKLAQKQTAAA